MGKFLLKTLLFLLVILTTFTLYVTFFGIETDRFDNLIKSKTNEINQYAKVDFNKVKIQLNIIELNLAVKLQNPKIIIKKEEIILSKLDLFLSIKSFFSSDFLLKRSEFAFAKNDIKDLAKITSIFLPRIINKRVEKILNKGTLSGEFILPFEINGNVGKNYTFSGKISESTVKLPKGFTIHNLTTEINYNNENEDNNFVAIINDGSLFDLDLDGSQINIKRKNNNTVIKSLLKTSGKFNYEQINKVASLFNKNTEEIKDIKGIINLKTDINFFLNDKFKINNLSYKLDGLVESLTVNIKKNKIISQYLTDYNSQLHFKDTYIDFTNSNRTQSANLKGLIKINNKFDSFNLKEKFSFNKNSFDLKGSFNLTNSNIFFPNLNFKKNSGEKSNASVNLNFILNKIYNIDKFEFTAGKNKIYLNNLKLNKNFQILDFKSIEVNTTNKKVNNDFSIKKGKKIIVSGKVFDAQPIFKSLYSDNSKKIFNKKFKSKIRVNFDKILTSTNDDIFDFAMIASIAKGSYEKLSLKGKYSKNEIIEMSIYQIDDDKKTIQVMSDRAKPFLKHFDFIKGFEGGKLEYESIITKDSSKSNLVLKDFKVSKVPALAKLLTLASLQGIADTLGGEGIRFDSFEMKSNTSGNVINIEDILALGPAVSILMNGYVDKGKVVSLRGTLVPATKLNSIIASIPVVGDILVGKKTGEGVVGVSFKMKGAPKDIKTTVNPIKTLTPRFIVRAIEKNKKNKKKEDVK
jgi:hypothetical protein